MPDLNEDNPYQSPQTNGSIETSNQPKFFDWIFATGLGLMSFLTVFLTTCLLGGLILVSIGGVEETLSNTRNNLLWILITVSVGLGVATAVFFGKRYLQSAKTRDENYIASKLRRQELLDLQNKQKSPTDSPPQTIE